MEQCKKKQNPYMKAHEEAKVLQRSIKHLKKELEEWMDETSCRWTPERIPQSDEPGDHQAEFDEKKANYIKDLRDGLEHFLEYVAEFFETISKCDNDSQELLDCYFDMVCVVIPVEVTTDISIVKIGNYLKEIKRFGRKLKAYLDSMKILAEMETQFDGADFGRYSTVKSTQNTTEDRLDEYIARQETDNQRQGLEPETEISNYDMSTKNYRQELSLEEHEWKEISKRADDSNELIEDSDHLKELLENVEAQIRLKTEIAEMEEQMPAPMLNWVKIKRAQEDKSILTPKADTSQRDVVPIDDDTPTCSRYVTSNSQMQSRPSK